MVKECATDTAKSGQHANNFDGVRLLGALFVLLSHQFALSGRHEPEIIGSHTFGNLGVLMFFSISGFLIMQSWQRDPHLPRFMARRLLRIWPGLAVVTLLTAFALGPLVYQLGPIQYFRSSEYRQYLHELYFGLSRGMLFPSNPFVSSNGSLWTIPIEVWCYLALGTAGVLGVFRRREALPLIIASNVVYFLFFFGGQAAGTAYAAGSHLFPSLVAWLYFAAIFFLGATINMYRPTLLTTHNKLVIAIALTLGLLAIVFVEYSTALFFIVPIVTISIAVRSWPWLKDAGCYGDLSYGIYLYAWPVQQVVILLLGKDAPYWLLAACSLTGAVALAFLSWHLVEKRALLIKPRGALQRNPTLNASPAG
ncbi:acyltransferase [Polaromonas sp. SM01]|uniref:acyltransferase family protein n=1 Tax=Polaromonas sp. SM01 TaxID=3085630 RepID=UPI00298233E3|nr:acyltransferase [Polaromonas sp. SM01]MDW5443937.1 acyltransferase [Polaromonas sp. SM01]